MQIVTICMWFQSLFFWKNTKNIDLLSAKLTKREVKVKSIQEEQTVHI